MADWGGEFSKEDLIELPCEFCDELFPIDILMQHQSGCRPDLLHYNNDSDPISPDVERLPSPGKVVEPIIKKEEKISPDISVVNSDKEEKVEIKPPLSSKAEIADLPLEDIKYDETPFPAEDPVTQEIGTKLMSYGSTISKRVEEEKPTFRAPPIPLLNNADKKDIDESSISLSDEEDAGEYLEDFWRRADIKLAQRLRKIQT